MKIIKGGVTEPLGFLASGIHCGLKKRKEKLDLALIYSEKLCNGAAVYTKNIVKGNPIIVTKKHLYNGKAQAIIINSGNANTCSGNDGLAKAYKMTKITADSLNISEEDVLVASTGVIGVPLNIELIENNIEKLKSSLSIKGNIYAREAIMTTDTIKKEVAVSCKIANKIVKIGAMAKGSGMICPNMATTLGVVTTDINISVELLHEALVYAVNKSFNRISIDGDESTNDSIMILANGLANNDEVNEKNSDYYEFLDSLTYALVELAKLVAKDGEGATKLLEAVVYNCKTEENAVILAKSIIKSNLVKAAMFGKDANWGRILCSLGYSGIEFDISKIVLAIESSKGYIELFKEGIPLQFEEEKATAILDSTDITILVNLNEGEEKGFAFGCDLTYEYVRINGDYRT
ncbi:bifunctional ornithine acetyltransferase/N-acetylglutamate synthase [Clostridium massiliamazoniense]|uniref:bifunctional ornithine acetyltransferase/N-acetylglutamate synthase n=1 Tax=Clostridium massiliamazoniense TaxID=1347366 RepID=UPI0006D7B620|nr:bifunctional ornithine acetyltransferase/N-acetylglutamate synthase [Clostridium massiliamazoniense]